MKYFDGPKPRLYAHRGASGELPENTLEAFLAGLEQGAERLELDVHMSSDGVVVVSHDATLERCTDGRGFIREHDLEQLGTVDAGAGFVGPDGSRPHRGHGFRIPTLADLLEAAPDVPLNIEIKQEQPAMEAAVLAVLDRFDARDRVLLAAEDMAVMARIREAAPTMTTGSAAMEVLAFVSALLNGDTAALRPAGAALQVPPAHAGMDIVTPDFISAAHEAAMEVHVWTINVESEMQRLLELGVDAIMTDYPARAFALMKRLGLR